jgi:hypothetical protein
MGQGARAGLRAESLKPQIGEWKMAEYAVEWRIEVEAANPEEAARKALKIQRDKRSIATVFHVFGESIDDETVIDLAEIDAGKMP